MPSATSAFQALRKPTKKPNQPSITDVFQRILSAHNELPPDYSTSISSALEEARTSVVECDALIKDLEQYNDMLVDIANTEFAKYEEEIEQLKKENQHLVKKNEEYAIVLCTYEEQVALDEASDTASLVVISEPPADALDAYMPTSMSESLPSEQPEEEEHQTNIPSIIPLKRTRPEDVDLHEFLTPKRSKKETLDPFESVRKPISIIEEHEGKMEITPEFASSIFRIAGIQKTDHSRFERELKNLKTSEKNAKLFQVICYIAYPNLYNTTSQHRMWYKLWTLCGNIAIIALWDEPTLVRGLLESHLKALGYYIDQEREKPEDDRLPIFKIESSFACLIAGIKAGSEEIIKEYIDRLSQGI